MLALASPGRQPLFHMRDKIDTHNVGETALSSVSRMHPRAKSLQAYAYKPCRLSSHTQACCLSHAHHNAHGWLYLRIDAAPVAKGISVGIRLTRRRQLHWQVVESLVLLLGHLSSGCSSSALHTLELGVARALQDKEITLKEAPNMKREPHLHIAKYISNCFDEILLISGWRLL